MCYYIIDFYKNNNKNMGDRNVKTNLLRLIISALLTLVCAPFAIAALPATSWTETCYLSLTWNDFNGTPYSKPETEVDCGWGYTIKSVWPNIADGIFNFETVMVDSYGNRTVTDSWVAMLDTTDPSVCIIEDVTLSTYYWSHFYYNNQNEGQLYFNWNLSWTLATFNFKVRAYDPWHSDYISRMWSITHDILGTDHWGSVQNMEHTFTLDLTSWTPEGEIRIRDIECMDNAWNKRPPTIAPGAMIAFNWFSEPITLDFTLDLINDITPPEYDSSDLLTLEFEDWTIHKFDSLSDFNHPVAANHEKPFRLQLFREEGSGLQRIEFGANFTPPSTDPSSTWPSNSVISNSSDNYYKVTSFKDFVVNEKAINPFANPQYIEELINIQKWECYTSGSTWSYNTECSEYVWWYNKSDSTNPNKVCDMVWNCVTTLSPENLKVTSNEPDSVTIIETTSGEDKYANGTDIRTVEVSDLQDRYWNPVASIYWVKNVDIDLITHSYLKSNMVSFTWADWQVIYINWNILDNKDDWIYDIILEPYNENSFDIDVKSYVPSDYEYWETSYSDKTFNINGLDIDVVCSQYWMDCWKAEWSAPNPTIRLSYDPVLYIWDLQSEINPIAEWVEKRMSFTWVFDSWINAADKANISKIGLTSRVAWDWMTIVKDMYMEDDRDKWSVISFSSDWKYSMWTSDFQWKSKTISKNDLEGMWTSISLVFTVMKEFAWSNWSTRYAAFSTFSYEINNFEIIMPGYNSWLTELELEEIESIDDLDENIDDCTFDCIEEDNIIDIIWNTQWDLVEWNETEVTLFKIRSDVHKSVEVLTKGFHKDLAVWNNNVYSISSLSNFNSMSQIDKHKISDNILYFKDTDVTINCGWECWISWRKTIIVDWGNLTLKSDLFYNDITSDILWLIVLNPGYNNPNLPNDQREKGNLLIHESVSNWLWVVFTEGSIMQVNDLWEIYWTLELPKNWELHNQLLWYWAIASRNTLKVDHAIVWTDISSLSWNNPSHKAILTKMCPYGSIWYEKSDCFANYRALDLAEQRNHSMYKNNLGKNIINNSSLTWIIEWTSDSSELPFAIASEFVWMVKLWGFTITEVWDDIIINNAGNSKLRKSTNINTPIQIEYDPRINTNPPAWFTNQQ